MIIFFHWLSMNSVLTLILYGPRGLQHSPESWKYWKLKSPTFSRILEILEIWIFLYFWTPGNIGSLIFSGVLGSWKYWKAESATFSRILEILEISFLQFPRILEILEIGFVRLPHILEILENWFSLFVHILEILEN